MYMGTLFCNIFLKGKYSHKIMQFLYFKESNCFKFDKTYKNTNIYNIKQVLINYSYNMFFIIYLFRVINVNHFSINLEKVDLT